MGEGEKKIERERGRQLYRYTGTLDKTRLDKIRLDHLDRIRWMDGWREGGRKGEMEREIGLQIDR